jgi:proline iminopeptidase
MGRGADKILGMGIIEDTKKISVPGGNITAFHIYTSKTKHALPLVYVHGGPGGNCDLAKHYLRDLASERPLIFYDQLGSYHSPAPISDELIKPERFAQELHEVFNAFSLEHACLIGHSWGACIAIDFALAQPGRTTGLILSSPLISTPRWIADARLLLSNMPEEAQAIIKHHEDAGTTIDPAYQSAADIFYKRHFCRLDPWPQSILDSFSKTNRALYKKMWGPAEFTCKGTLKDYDRFPDLHKLSMPVLLTAGRYDEARPETMEDAAREIPNSRLVIFEDSAHVPYIEESNAFREAIANFARNLA